MPPSTSAFGGGACIRCGLPVRSGRRLRRSAGSGRGPRRTNRRSGPGRQYGVPGRYVKQAGPAAERGVRPQKGAAMREVPSPRDKAYMDLLHYGLVLLRNFARGGRLEFCPSILPLLQLPVLCERAQRPPGTIRLLAQNATIPKRFRPLLPLHGRGRVCQAFAASVSDVE